MYPDGRIEKFDNYAAAVSNEKMQKDRLRVMKADDMANHPTDLPSHTQQGIVTNIEQQGQLVAEHLNMKLRKVGYKPHDWNAETGFFGE